MRGAGLRCDCLQEAQLGDAIVLHELIDHTTFGSKTDPTLEGKAATLPGPMSEQPLSWRVPIWVSRISSSYRSLGGHP
jgi:hypothetical protein